MVGSRARGGLSLLLAIVSLFVGVVIGAGTAQAASAPYPPPACATLTVSTTTPVAGATIQVSGSNWEPNATVRIIITSTPRLLGTVVTDATGSFSTSVTIPADMSGQHTITAEGPSVCPLTAGIVVTIRTSPGGGGDGGDGGLPFTGADILGILGAALLLILAGAALATRRSKARA